MAKQTLGSLLSSGFDLAGKRVLVRADFNVPLDAQGNITDDTRIRAALPTVQALTQAGAKVILTSHLGRPVKKDKETGAVKVAREGNSLAPVATRLSQLLGQPVAFAPDCIGPEAEAVVNRLENGQVALLENVRFYPEEEDNDPEFARKLASLADLFVNDAFGSAHRAHASTAGVTAYLQPAVAGYLVERELQFLSGAIEDPRRPLAAIIGGSKVSTKIGVIERLLEKVDKLLLGGGMIFTFYQAQGIQTGKSLVETDKLDLARSLMEKAKERGVELLLPVDVVVADRFDKDAQAQTVSIHAIPEDWMGLDIGPESVKAFQSALQGCQTVVWNGPMGVFEFDRFALGTEAIARTLADLTQAGATTIIGGGDSVAAVEKVGLADKMTHISTGGGASLELLEGKVLPGIAALTEA
ncbi:phosphoglycerate kinase [Synechococcus sp. JA-2-3B'a(2-13)]|uniref:Phosphoglycerate kinase n=1 Tax=Synechococcus sp. (strain JA-2-3B'a(2-13)) TaxID=321332 RepID=PGK_SYNJB|nr:phosphoglycerate kinase [Synechococcus sp. JA-2-3B'a(2-13)]Q2JKX6.1 RecName: Full=Phosphoglycerate kinase [Synechococcus sp. JA-2-3B'a(2-13)]ABD02652.1 phosphoglycerate kinase [Synechococcus sp. JA-2-3B'a(2-13)]